MNKFFLPLQLQRFIAAGGLATLFHWFVMTALITLGLEPMRATAGGSVTGAAFNYVLQRRPTFRISGSHRRTIWRYVSSCFVAWLCNLVFFFLFHSVLTIHVTLSQVATTGLVAAMNYIIYQRFVFHE